MIRVYPLGALFVLFSILGSRVTSHATGDRPIDSVIFIQKKASLQLKPTEIDGQREQGSNPTLLILAATHGSGTSVMSTALSYHPCLISVGEPFGGWSGTDAHEDLYAPDGKLAKGHTALFRSQSTPDKDATFTKLSHKVDGSVGTHVSIPQHLHMEAGGSITNFFEAVRNISCESYNLADDCGGRCIFAHKLFPEWIHDDYDQVRDYLTDARTATIHMIRNEADVAASNAKRFGGYSDAHQQRDIAWHQYLTNTSQKVSDSHLWYEIPTEEIFRSPSDYFEFLLDVFRDFQVDQETLVENVRGYLNWIYTPPSQTTANYIPKDASL